MITPPLVLAHLNKEGTLDNIAHAQRPSDRRLVDNLRAYHRDQDVNMMAAYKGINHQSKGFQTKGGWARVVVVGVNAPDHSGRVFFTQTLMMMLVVCSPSKRKRRREYLRYNTI